MLRRNFSSKRNRGAALIMAILVVALASLLASRLIWHQNLWQQQIQGQRDLAQTRALAMAAIDWARAVLAQDARTSRIDHLHEAWATEVPMMPAEEGELGGYIQDEQARLNLNNLVRNGRSSKADFIIYQHLLQSLQLPLELADTLTDWLDSDDSVHGQGAEDAWYLAQHPAYRTANRELTDIDNLLHVRGYDFRIVQKLRPYVTALPGYNPVNINTVSAVVLAAVLHEFPAAEIQRLMSERERIPYLDSSDIRQRFNNPELAATPALERLDTRSSYFTAHIQTRFGRAHSRMTALLHRPLIWPDIIGQKFN